LRRFGMCCCFPWPCAAAALCSYSSEARTRARTLTGANPRRPTTGHPYATSHACTRKRVHHMAHSRRHPVQSRPAREDGCAAEKWSRNRRNHRLTSQRSLGLHARRRFRARSPRAAGVGDNRPLVHHHGMELGHRSVPSPHAPAHARMTEVEACEPAPVRTHPRTIHRLTDRQLPNTSPRTGAQPHCDRL
jgi:hypothetical protein